MDLGLRPVADDFLGPLQISVDVVYVHKKYGNQGERKGKRPVPGCSLTLCISRFITSPRVGTERRGTGSLDRPRRERGSDNMKAVAAVRVLGASRERRTAMKYVGIDIHKRY
jgi:hypothetical protein